MENTNFLRDKFNRLDKKMVRFMSVHGIDYLRISLAIVFIWFGWLKVIGASPVFDLVANSVYWISPDFFVPFLGYWEILVGIGLLFRFQLRLTLLLFWLQMAGTFIVLIVQPDIAFQAGNPLLLTTEGEFVIKNLILITAGLVIGSTIQDKKNETTSTA